MLARRWPLLFLAIVMAIPTLTATWWWFAPKRMGERRDSPDGRYVASAYNVTRNTLFHGPRTSIEVSIFDIDSGRAIWSLELNHPSTANVPDYGLRGLKFVVWAADSSSVTIPILGAQQVVLPVQ